MYNTVVYLVFASLFHDMAEPISVFTQSKLNLN